MGTNPQTNRPATMKGATMSRNWYQITNGKEDAELLIYDFIGRDPWTGEGVDAKNLVRDLAGLKGKKLNVRINSPGGSAADGMAIYNAILNHDGPTTTTVDGIAASAASFIAQAGKTRRMAKASMMFVHPAQGFAMGDSRAMEKNAADLKQWDSVIAGIYKEHGKDDEDYTALMNAETWMTPEQAVELGLADEVIETKTKPTNCVLNAVARFGWKTPPGIPAMETQNMADSETPAIATNEAEAVEAAQVETQKPNRVKRDKAATLAEAKASAPGAPADFILNCLEKAMTAAEIVNANSERLSAENAALKERIADMERANADKAAPANTTKAVPVAEASNASGVTEDSVKAEWDADPAIRAEFGTFDRFKAWKGASVAGRIRTARRNQ